MTKFGKKWRVVGSMIATLGIWGAVIIAQPAHAAPALNAFVSAPFVQGPSAAGAQIETFDTTCPQTWWSGMSNEGTLVGPCTSMNGDIWGGSSTTSGVPTLSDPSEQTKYGAVFEGQSITVTLDHPASYVGFNWQAGDWCNTLTIGSGGTDIATFTTEDLMGMIYSGTVGEWSSNDYLYNPARSQWIGYPFAFIHLVGVNGLTFDTITFSEPCSGGFEFDNFTIVDAPVTLDPTTVVPISDTTPPDANGDGTSDFEQDSDGDGISDPFEDTDGDGVAESFEDTDGDGLTDYEEQAIELPNTGVPVAVEFALGGLLLIAGLTLIVVRRRRATQTPV